MKTSTIIDGISSDEIGALFNSLKDEIKEIKQNFTPKMPTEYLSRTEVSEILKCDISTVHNWTVKKKLKAYGIGNRVLYKRNEVEAAIIPLDKD